MSDERDQLLEALLCEAFGRDAPPDLTERICRRAYAVSVWHNPWLLGTALVTAAALIAVVVSLSLPAPAPAPQQLVQPSDTRPPQQPAPPTPGDHSTSGEPAVYPAPSATGDFQVVEGGAPRRGATLLTGLGGAQLHLGGYCQVRLSPHSRVRIHGQEREEEIQLQEGQIECDVAREHGRFAVRTPLGKVSVTGTSFQVQVRKGGEDMTRSMYIKVLAGTVLVASAWGEMALAAGQEHEQPAQGTLTGVVTAKTERSISVRIDESNEVKQFIPNWIGGLPKDGGGLDKQMLHTIRETPVGSRVRVQWMMLEHLRVVGLEVLERPRGDRPEGEHRENTGNEPEKKDGGPHAVGHREGVLVGNVTGKGEAWIEVQGEGQEKPTRYTPRWIGGMPKDGGGLDKHMLEIFRGLNVGNRIRLTWVVDERPRAVAIEKLH